MHDKTSAHVPPRATKKKQGRRRLAHTPALTYLLLLTAGTRSAAVSPESWVSGVGDAAAGFAQPKTHARTPSHKERETAVADFKLSETMQLSAYQFYCERASSPD
jgi:hypothetical protein